eukprot:14708416-Alexandrium_andersonii.AAC.1
MLASVMLRLARVCRRRCCGWPVVQAAPVAIRRETHTESGETVGAARAHRRTALSGSHVFFRNGSRNNCLEMRGT